MKRQIKLFAVLAIVLAAGASCNNNPLGDLPLWVVLGPCYAGHTWELESHKEPTCMETGEDVYVCSVCGKEKTDILAKIPHAFGDDPNECIYCHNLFYSSLDEFNEKVTLENAKGKIVEVALGNLDYSDIEYEEHNSGYKGNGLLIGRLPGGDIEPLNRYNAEPAEKGEYTFIFKDGTINSSSNGYSSIDNINGSVIYMLIPGNSSVTFENVVFNNVVSFGIQNYTSPWSYLDSIRFENCIFNGLVVGYSPADNLVFNGCTFNEYLNGYQDVGTFNSSNNSNPIWMRSGKPSYSGEPLVVSMKTVVFTNNTVTSSRPVKFERIGQLSEALGYTATLTILDNQFDMSCSNDADVSEEEKHMALFLGQQDNTSKFILYDDGNKVNDGIPMYTSMLPDSDTTSGGTYYFEVLGTRILDRNGNPKEITARVWKSLSEEFVLRSL